jgi:PAS domain S-box-containing protein
MYSPFSVPGPDQNSQPTRIAEALRNLQHAVAQCHDAVFISDATGVLTRVNAAFERLTGQSSMELIGTDLSVIVEGGGQSAEYQQIWRNIFEEKRYKGILKLKTKSGEFREVEATITPVRGSHQHIVSLVGTCHVIAEPGMTASDVRNEKRVSPDIARMVHDLRNMLLVVVAHADLACESLFHEHPSRGHLENVRSAAKSAAALIYEFAQGEAAVPSNGDSTPSLPRTEQSAAYRTHASRLLAVSEPHDQIERQPATILLVEDECLIRESSAEFLSGAGFKVISAINGEEALLELRLHQGSIDVLITDMMLPNMSGAELAATVTKAHPESKVLIISGHSDCETLGEKGDHFLAKPFSFSALRGKIRELLQEKKPPRSVSAGV